MHVIEGGSRIEVHVPSLGRTVPGRVVATDKLNDLALFRVDSDSVRTLGEIPYRLAAAGTVAVGQDAWTLGFPLGTVMGSTARLATGTIDSLSGLHDAPGRLQISAPIQPGNSGGPLFNSQGELIGVVVSGLNAKYFWTVRATSRRTSTLPSRLRSFETCLNLSPIGLKRSTHARLLVRRRLCHLNGRFNAQLHLFLNCVRSERPPFHGSPQQRRLRT